MENIMTNEQMLIEAKTNQNWQQWAYLIATHNFEKVTNGMSVDQKTRLIAAITEYESKNAIR